MNQSTPLSIIHQIPVTRGMFPIPPTPERFEPSTHAVNFRRDPRDWGVPFLRAFGLTAQAIATAQGLSVGQVQYRLKKINSKLPPEQRISSCAYRNGTSPVARLVIEQVGRKVKQMITPKISNALTHDAAQVINI